MFKNFLKKGKKESGNIEIEKSKFKRFVIPLSIGTLVVTAIFAGFYFFNLPQAGNSSLKLSLIAKNGDLNGIEKNTSFILKTSKKISEKNIKKYLKFDPAVDFEVKEKKFLFFSLIKNVLASNRVSSFGNEYEIIPKALNEGSIYNIVAATSSDQNFDHDYSWAFNVKEQFNIKESLPGNEATQVPVNTGIEISFNRLNIGKDIEKYFSIEPKTDGRFETGLDKIIFIPGKDLRKKTLYKITIKKGYAADNEELKEDKAIVFETVSPQDNENFSELYWNNDFFEMTPDKEGFLEANGNATSSELSVLKYISSNEFLKDYYKYHNRSNSWSRYNQEVFSPSAKAKEILKFNPELLKRNEGDNYGLIKLPKKLDSGVYIFKLTADKISQYAFVRVSSLAFYYTEINGDGLIWAYDYSNKKPFSDINTSLIGPDGKERNLGKTDESGLVKFDSSTDKEENPELSLIFKGENFDETVVPDMGRALEKRKNYYQGYLNTDRYAYRLTDKLHFWGVVKGRSFDLRQKKVKVSLDYGTIEKEVTVSPFDTIQGELEFQGLSSGYHNLTVSYNDETIAVSGIEVFSFEKPLYKIEVTPDKNFSTIDTQVKARIKVSFFDGTPVKDMNLNYTVNWQKTEAGNIKTDGNGEAILNYVPKYYFEETSDQYTEYWTTYPMNLRIIVRPELAEEGEIWGEAYVNIYAPKLFMQSEENEKNNSIAFKVKVNELNLAAVNENEIIGGPKKGQQVKVKIIRYYYEQKLSSETYDPIEKKKIKNYDYELKKKIIKEAVGATDDKGEWSIVVDKNEVKDNGYLKAIFSTEDDGGKKVMSSAESYNYYPNSGNSVLSLVNLDLEKKIATSYKIGDQIHLKSSLSGDSKAIDNRTLIIRFQENLNGAEMITKEDYTDTFVDNYKPSMTYRAVKVMPNGFLESDILTASFDEEEKKMDIDIQADKEKYRPRETINLSVSVKDKDKKGIKSIANIAAVDEALFNVTPWGYGGDILETLYSDIAVYPFSISTAYVTDFKNGSEKGGCFVAGTKISMSDKSNKNIEDIRVGDEIETFENENSKTLAKSIVQGISSHEVGGYLLINQTLRLTLEHKIMVNGTWKAASQVKIGDYLLNDKGKSEEVKEIKFIKAKNVKVYNIIVGRYHTYFADGYYVHNAEKGGGGDARNFFEDTPLYKEIESDDNGLIKTSFKAPDNLTSWRISVNAYGQKDFKAGSRYKLIPVGLPLFADAVVAKQYLVGDNPEIKIRAFGTDYKKDQPVILSLSSGSLKVNFSTTTTNNEAIVLLGKLPVGKHKLTVSVKQGELKDSVEKTFEVFENYFRKYKSESQLIKEGAMNLKGNSKAFTDVVFVDDGKGKYYDQLLDSNRTASARSDIQAASYLAAKSLNDNFYGGKDQFYADIDLNTYLNHGGDSNVFSLFPYGQSNYLLTAELIDVMPEKIDSSYILASLNSKLAEKKLTIEEISQILYGMSAIGQPDLPFINYLKADAKTSLEAKIYLAIALYKAGDKEGARDIYYNELLPSLKIDNDKMFFEVSDNVPVNIKATAVFGILTSYIEQGTAKDKIEKIFKYLDSNSPKDDSVALEKVMILKNEITNEDKNDASFSFKTGNRTGKVDLSHGQAYQLTFSEAELKTLIFSEVKGRPKAITYFEEYTDQNVLVKSDLVGIDKSYLINGKDSTDFKEGDLVLVRIDPNFNKEAPDDNYQIADYLPAGLKPVIREYNLDVQPTNDCNPVWYPTRITDEAIYFNIGKWFEKTNNCQHRTINYPARVVGRGEFRAQPTSIQSLNDLGIINISKEKRLLIK